MKKLFNFIDRGETIERNILFLKALMIREQWIKSL